MISHISIKNFAIIENTEFSLYPGLNILTGETGAGKSIIIEAVSLALGARADKEMVRTGCDRAVIQLAADLDDEEIIITREISSAGKSLCRINGEIVSLSQLSSCCRRIADIHGQYDHQSLINPEYHLSLIDAYYHKKIEPLKAEIASVYGEYASFKGELSALTAADAERARRLDFMRFESDEIEKAAPAVGEDDELGERIAVMQNGERIYAALSEAYDASYGGTPSAIDALSFVMKELAGISDVSADLQALSDEISDIYYRFEDLCRDIREKRDGAQFSPEELDMAINRMELLDNLKRKYGGSIASVLEYKENADRELAILENADERTEELRAFLEMTGDRLRSLSEELSELRREAAARLCAETENELRRLSFSNAELEAVFGRISEDFSPRGTDTAQFFISTNVGEPKKPLSKIASGGEMSRIMLAFKSITADFDKIPVMIFDEIDAGISGITASVVGQKLKEIAANHQVICITHLPQIAACGAHNYKIAKESDETSTRTFILPLDGDGKVREIARLLGGASVTDTTLQNAAELISASI